MLSGNALVRLVVGGLFLSLVAAGAVDYWQQGGRPRRGAFSCPRCNSEAVCLNALIDATTEDGKVRLESASTKKVMQEIAAHPDQVVVLDLWADFCVPCKEEFPGLLRLQKKYAGVVCMSVCLDEPEGRAGALRFLKSQGATARNFMITDAQEVWQDTWNVKSIPLVLVYKDGRQVARFDGDDPDHPFSYADVDAAVGRLLK